MTGDQLFVCENLGFYFESYRKSLKDFKQGNKGPNLNFKKLTLGTIKEQEQKQENLLMEYWTKVNYSCEKGET